ncbi:phage/plasmid primase, P4 family [Corynebacterium freneyi]|uniref:DNA primase family protein n=1 Tax=Corynebacterium freneyi TaxID=134034 RepID=UPI00254F1707|nr:phage/plasmid primase, P4 family [Corynebacterium freneyi]MDK8768959.1 phage/plasmid primase, P4 family [Corynebacterium freneyi]
MATAAYDTKAADAAAPPAPPVPAIIDAAVCEKLADLGRDAARAMEPTALAGRLLAAANGAIEGENVADAKHGRPKVKRAPVDRLPFYAVAAVIIETHHVINLSPSAGNTDPDLDLLAVYDDDPASPTHGTYQTSERAIRRIARRYAPDLSDQDAKHVQRVLAERAPTRTRGTDRNLVAVRNGVFDYASKTLLPFSPDRIFLSKAAVDYNPDAANVQITNPDDGTVWDVESWMTELSDDPEVVELLWEIIGAIVRPYVSWNKSAWFYSERGNNGKGTLVELMRNIVGDSYASIPLADFSKDFMLEPLTRANCILVDENDVGTFIDRTANLKAIITNDVISINRKYKSPIAYQFYGFMVQCLNEFPRIRDKSESFYRRQLFVPFTKCFTGAERRYIKDDYIQRRDVLEYVLKRVLHMDYYELSTPAVAAAVLDEYKELNDPVRAFWVEHKDLFQWDLVPRKFLYDLYLAWMKRTTPSGAPMDNRRFLHALKELVQEDPGWDWPDHVVRASQRMELPEPMIGEYELKGWYHPDRPFASDRPGHHTLGDRQKNGTYRGIVRRTPRSQSRPPAPTQPAAEAVQPQTPAAPDLAAIQAAARQARVGDAL